MSNEKKTDITFTIINPLTLFTILLVLKVSGCLVISWWWVTCPLWIPFAAFLVVSLSILVGGLIIFAVIFVIGILKFIAECADKSKG